MWSFKRVAPITLLLLALAASSGCGFQPMYGESGASSSSVTDELAKIHVQSIPDREGQLLHNALLTRLTPKGQSRNAIYSLSVAYSSDEEKVALQKDNTATRNVITYTAEYRLMRDDTVLTRGKVIRLISYDYLAEHYANVSAEKDTQARSAKILADAIRNELAAYFIRRDQAITGAGGGSGSSR